jgi:hypothetical protein
MKSQLIEASMIQKHLFGVLKAVALNYLTFCEGGYRSQSRGGPTTANRVNHLSQCGGTKHTSKQQLQCFVQLKVDHMLSIPARLCPNAMLSV